MTHLRQALTRAMMRRLMNITEHDETPPDPLDTGKFWTSDNPVDEHRYLRPNWSTWHPNIQGWVNEVGEKIISQGSQYYVPPIVQREAFFASLKPGEIEKCIKTYYKSLQARYLKAQQPQEKRQSSAVTNRHNTRKNTVSKHMRSNHKGLTLSQKARWRTDSRDKVPEVVGPEWDWLFEARYQSTDDSESEGEEQPEK